MDEIEEPTSPSSPRVDSRSRPVSVEPIRDRVLDLVALLLLTTLAAAVFLIAGSEAFTAVTSVGLGLFASWRGRPPRP
ncbi:hypothetical protein ACWGKU_21915 [Kitasatospora sp. NPDC054768]|uniref:hypothetical protein n=1 Tax=Kitasatospora sp. NPDC101183 TaxID=3364100 RepID=UPI0038198BB2